MQVQALLIGKKCEMIWRGRGKGKIRKVGGRLSPPPKPGGGGWTPHMKGVGMLVGNFE